MMMSRAGTAQGDGAYRSLMEALRRPPSFDALGAPLEQVRRELWALGNEMCDLVEPEERGSIEEALRALAALVCRVAVIGQVKAGKSTFISALVGRPNLLPSDVNPWTTVVTNLHFVHGPHPTESAHFTFFGAEEWSRIAEGGGPLRELTERLVPGFNSELLRLQVDAMRRRAERRLGAQFHELLGQRHDFPSITRELLERYVAAGDPEATSASPAGQYADLTKVADLVFSSMRPGLPVTLIDTPGTNDPLLVRDEITRLNLASADLYIVVLTAQQPLSASDVSLLRILRGLHKERVIVFINRIDQVADAAGNAGRLTAHVKARLKQEFPASHIPVIVGSAWWGSAALSNDPALIERAAGGQFRSYCDQMWRGAGPEAPTGEDLRERLLLASGIPSVLGAAHGLMLRGSDAHTVQQLAAFLLELARSGEVAARAELKALERVALPVGGTEADGLDRQHGLAQWQAELDQLTKAAEKVQGVIEMLRTSLSRIVDQSIEELWSRCARAIEGFTRREMRRLEDAYHLQESRVWQADPQSLRSELEHDYHVLCGHAQERFAQIESVIREHLAVLLREGVLEGLIDIGHPEPGEPLPRPMLSALSSTMALDLEQPWWKAWLADRPTLESRRDELKRLIDAECVPMAADLADTVRTVLEERAERMAQHVTAVSLDVVNSMRRRSLTLVARLRETEAPIGEDRSRARMEQRQALDAIRVRLAAWSELADRLAGVEERSRRLAEEHSAAAS